MHYHCRGEPPKGLILLAPFRVPVDEIDGYKGCYTMLPKHRVYIGISDAILRFITSKMIVKKKLHNGRYFVDQTALIWSPEDDIINNNNNNNNNAEAQPYSETTTTTTTTTTNLSTPNELLAPSVFH
jgi:hypothetical protein